MIFKCPRREFQNRRMDQMIQFWKKREREMETYVYTKHCTLNSYRSSSHNCQKLETSKFPSRSKCSHSGVCIQWALLSAGRDQLCKHTRTWVDLKGIMLNTGSQSWQIPPTLFSSCSNVKKAAAGMDRRPTHGAGVAGAGREEPSRGWLWRESARNVRRGSFLNPG